ncbi:MAG: acyltransferase [Myxococcota bacterium]
MSEPITSRKTHWANVGEAGFVLGMRVLLFIHRVFGRWPFRVALAPVVFYYLLKTRIARDSSYEYFRRLGLEPGLGRSFRHITSFAETLLDKALAVSGRYPFTQLHFSGREVMLESMAQNRGGVLVTAHMGCLEVTRLAAERKNGPRLNVLVHTKRAEQFNAMLERMDPDTQVKLIQVTDVAPSTAALLAQKVDAGEFVVLAADRVPVSDASGRTVAVDFLGAPAHFPIGPWVLANALKCQVIFFTTVHEGDSYRVTFERLAERIELPRGRREEALKAYVSLYAKKLEEICRASPYDWFNFFPFWEPPRA